MMFMIPTPPTISEIDAIDVSSRLNVRVASALASAVSERSKMRNVSSSSSAR